MEWVELFLGIGDKVKKCRTVYALKQASFSKFGISQHYLSMIESQKRQPTLEMIDQIYDAFYILTNGEIKNLYTKETFRYTEEEQTFAYLTKKCQTERIPLHYHESLKIAQQFNLCDLLYRLNVGMGEHYQSILQYEVSTNYFMKAIHVANGIHCNLAYCYHQLGHNMKETDNYKVALMYYSLAAQYTDDKMTAYYYRLRYNMALINLELEKYAEGLEEIESILIQCQDSETLAGTLMLKYYAFIKMKRYQEAYELIIDFINREKYEYYKGMAYHNLGGVLMLNQNYEEALVTVQKAIKIRKTLFQRQLSRLLEGKIYFLLDQYEEAKQCFLESKEEIMEGGNQRYVKEWYEFSLKLAYSMSDKSQLSMLLGEMRDLVKKGCLSEAFLNGLKLELIRWYCQSECDELDEMKRDCLTMISI
ncbi:XRE family transcriptional regulator [Turicibacter sanguinis]|nr:XRE family transcriptional regulator [Turicibacter sanguinis]MTN82745.1 XRE family transcriptional regulator [Turicibacter sanguinis]MTN87351.1 XRE family transcriptional regulator [Turicibacter sanguinis]MTN88475.1 XRE family transcriptional regulator [Turicibacter sanguinis]MTN92119.1 XRE family transcriptional regulator [Turicibacter sanguinis]